MPSVSKRWGDGGERTDSITHLRLGRHVLTVEPAAYIKGVAGAQITIRSISSTVTVSAVRS